MNLPPLPLTDGALFVDNSGWLEGLQSCHRLIEYKALYRRIAAGEKPSLNFGSCIHLCLEHRYRKYGVGEVGPDFWNELSTIIQSFFDSHPSPVDDWRTPNWALETMKRYMAKYPIEEFNLLYGPDLKPLIELPFTLPLYTHKSSLGEIPVIYTGRIDLPSIVNKEVWIGDHKTSSMLGGSFFDRMKRSAQQKGYCWAFSELTKGTDVDIKITGYFINAIRTKEPPLYVNDPTRKQGKLNPETWWTESLQREKYYTYPGMLEEWKTNTIELLEAFFWHYSRGYMPEETTYCTLFGRCPYFDICTLAKDDRGTMLASGLYTDNTWSPLHESTEPKQ